MNQCRLWLTKEEIEPDIISGATVVVIDVLLATTTLLTIMEHGARQVFPVESIEEARSLSKELEASSCITGGEQGGFKIEEFTCGHLPTDYPPKRVANKDVIFLTTNGTRAISRSKNADEVLIANVRNAPTVADYLNTLEDEDVYIICAGSGGHFSLEDFLCASLIINRLDLAGVKCDDAVRIALEQQFENRDKIIEILGKSRVGKASLRKGMQELIQFTGDFGVSDTMVRAKGRELVLMAAGSDVHGKTI